MSQTREGVVDLVGAGVPADQGLSSLGLLLQLAGSLTAAYAAFVGLMLIDDSRQRMWRLVLVGLCIARSLSHRAAGTELIYGRRTLAAPDATANPLRGVHRYVAVAAVQTLAVAGLLVWRFEVTACTATAIAAGLMTWPILLISFIALPRFRRFATGIPHGEDRGFEGASILMAVFGIAGLLCAAAGLVFMLGLPSAELQQGPTVLVMTTLVMMAVRSIIHAHAGTSGLREQALHPAVDRAVERTHRYANFGVITAFCAGGATLLVAMTSSFDVTGMVLVVGMCWMLMAWPLIVRRFFGERQFADMLAGEDAPIHRRAPDAGLTGLGWLLIAAAALVASLAIPALLMSSHGRAGSGMLIGNQSIWWVIGIVTLQIWAGFELVRMSPQHRAISNAFALVSTAVGLYLMWPVISSMHPHASHDEFALLGVQGMVQDSAALMLVASTLVLPVATFVLVNRRHWGAGSTATARARIRPRLAG